MIEFIVEFMTRYGYLGVFALMALENLFPPIPSEMIMPLAGLTAAEGSMNIVATVVAGTTGSVLGTLPWYYAGSYFGIDRLKRIAGQHGRFLTMTPDDVERAQGFFQVHGHKAVFIGRLVPAVRTLISVPAGIAKLSLMRYLIYSTAGSLIWTGALAAAGFLLQSQYDQVSKYIDPVSKAIVGILVVFYLYRVATYKKAKINSET